MSDVLGRETSTYLDHLRVERGLSANSLAAYGRDLTRYIAWLRARGVTEPSAVTGDLLESYASFLRSPAPEGPSLAPASIARMLAAVRGLHRFWAIEHVTADDLTRYVTPPKPDRRLPKALSVDEVQRLIAAAGTDGDTPSASSSSLCDVALIELLYGTGARISEVVALDVDDVERALGDPALGLRLIGKGDKERLVPLGSYARAAVEAWLVRGRPALATRAVRATPALLLNERGGRLSRQSAFNRVRAAAHRAGIVTEVSPHSLRHSYATHLLDGGADVRVVQELLGHASVTTTQIYTLVTVDHLRDVYREAHPRARSAAR
ncbi:MAG TPA: site-specific tyrosine recombinase XerD [Propionibacteriaceae bacterium]|nr:site-specific tyrosine recombinase XerD [Propionibacteriaceae bacterium]